MRNYTPQGELKVRNDASQASKTPTLLASGYISPVNANDSGVAALQAIAVEENLEGLASRQAPDAGIPLSLKPGVDDLVPARKIALSSTADLSAITFIVQGLAPEGEVQTESVAGPIGVEENLTGIADYQAPAATVPLVLEEAAADLNPPRRLALTAWDDFSHLGFTIVGTDENGNPQTVVGFRGPNNGTVLTDELWSEVTSITPGDVYIRPGTAELQVEGFHAQIPGNPLIQPLTGGLALDSASPAVGVNDDFPIIPGTGTLAIEGQKPTGLTGLIAVGWPDTYGVVETIAGFSGVLSITPSGSDSGKVQAGWRDSDTGYPLRLSATSFSSARHIILTSDDDLSYLVFEITGLDAGGAAISEMLNGPNDGTVISALRYMQITSIRPLAVVQGAVKAGWPDEVGVIYQALSDSELSHLYLYNTGNEQEEILLFVWAGSAEIPWKKFELGAGATKSVLRGEAALPLPKGAEIRASGPDPDVVSFLVHGRALS